MDYERARRLGDPRPATRVGRPVGRDVRQRATMRLAEDGFEFEPVGELTLKGKAEPVPAWRLVGKRAYAARAERRPTRRARRASSQVVDARSTSRAASAAPSLVIAGDAGVGKSRLAEELRELARERGSAGSRRAVSRTAPALAYWPFAELLRADAELVERRGRRWPVHRASPGRVGASVEELEPEAFRRGLHAAIASALGGLADAQPVLLSIEDVHWADPSSLGLIGELGRLCAERRCRARPDHAAGCADGAGRSRAGGADDRAAAVRCDRRRGVRPRTPPGCAASGLAASVADRTGGNPLFVEEIVASLRDSDALTQDGDTWRIAPAGTPLLCRLRSRRSWRLASTCSPAQPRRRSRRHP